MDKCRNAVATRMAYLKDFPFSHRQMSRETQWSLPNGVFAGAVGKRDGKLNTYNVQEFNQRVLDAWATCVASDIVSSKLS